MKITIDEKIEKVLKSLECIQTEVRELEVDYESDEIYHKDKADNCIDKAYGLIEECSKNLKEVK